MKPDNTAQNNYAIYCQEHSCEFRDELRTEASKALRGWPCRIAGVLLLLSSIVTYLHPANQSNPYIGYSLLAYLVPILIVAGYPIITLILPVLDKYSRVVLDILLISGLLGFIFTLAIILSREIVSVDDQNLLLVLSGQINFALLLSTGFSFHTTFKATFLRNIAFTLIASIAIIFLDVQFFQVNWLQILQGFCSGLIFSWVFYDSIRARFYLRSTDADVRQHLYNQLSKLVYPHQLERIKLGDELESTMPLKEGKAIINVFDVQKSSEIRHEKTQEFFMAIFQAFLQICMQGYQHNPLRSRAFRLKETGDGFISSIGYPFLAIESASLADSAVSTALAMFVAFNEEVEKFNYSRPINAAMGLAYNSVQGTFQSGGIRSYDLFGDALIQASKYEELRKQPVIFDFISEHARMKGLDHFNILIVQEVVYNSLSPEYRRLFIELNLDDDRFKNANIHLMYDNDAKLVYFHVLK